MIVMQSACFAITKTHTVHTLNKQDKKEKLVPKNGCPKIKCDRPFLNSSKWRNTVVN